MNSFATSASSSSREQALAPTTSVCILSSSKLEGWNLNFVHEKLKRAGLSPEDIRFITLSDGWLAIDCHVIVTLDERPMNELTGKKSITKWHLSLLDALSGLRCRKVIPTFHPDQVKADWSLGLYMELAFRRAREESGSHEYTRKPHRFLLNPPLDETFAVLDSLVEKDWLALDIETGRGQINTFGIAWSESDAIAIGCLPDRCSADNFLELWRRIARVCEGPARKLMQNGIYETMYLARYGIRIRNFAHDTMVAQKFLWPELEKGLDNVGRLYTREPYWKDDGRIASEAGRRKDWGAVKDWPAHYRYNACDTTGTFEAAFAQRRDLEARGMLEFHDGYLVRMFPIVAEMCLRGLPLCTKTQAALVTKYEQKVAELTGGLSRQINPRSPKQKLSLFRDKGYKIPKVKAAEGGSRDSVNELSLKKLRLKHPDDTDITKLLEIAEYEKALSSYFHVVPGDDSCVHFMLDPHGAETGRWSGSKDPWGRGFNPQTVPSYAKSMFRWRT